MFSKEKLLKILSGEEYEPCEFKKAKSSYSTTKCLEYCTGIANSGGGYLIFGVEDKSKIITGSNAFLGKTNDLKKVILEKLRIRINSYEFNFDSKRVLVLELPSHTTGRLIGFEGQYFSRNGESLIKMSCQASPFQDWQRCFQH
ncbi:MAG: ATP-binding protein [Caldisericia bacterium]|nr:ATP-binding protein [Caldisericia bacterium]